MAYTLTTIFADGETPNQVDLYPETPSLKTMQDRVGGWLETVPHFKVFGDRYCVAFCDEEGKLKNKHVNIVATAHWHSCYNPAYGNDVLVGDVLIITADTRRELEEL